MHLLAVRVSSGEQNWPFITRKDTRPYENLSKRHNARMDGMGSSPPAFPVAQVGTIIIIMTMVSAQGGPSDSLLALERQWRSGPEKKKRKDEEEEKRGWGKKR